MADAQAIYRKMDQLAEDLKSAGQQSLADRLSYRVHKAVYTTRSEVLEVLRTFLVCALDDAERERFPEALRLHIEESIFEINQQLKGYPPPIGIN